MKYLLGLDNGGTTTKAALYDLRGKEIAVSSVATAMLAPKPGFTERDMEEMWDANCRVIRDVMEQASVSPQDIAGVAICGHGKGLYLWGKDGHPARNGIISTDNRAWEYPVRWKRDGTEAKVFARSCQHILACQPVSLLAWLRDNEPDVMGNIRWVFECKDYVRFRMTGEARAEITDYSGANLVNLHTCAYDEELLALFGLAAIREALPPLCNSTEIAGYVTEEAAERCGLLPGTPVAGGMFDIDACALAVNVLDENNICMIAGTWSINEYPKKTPVTDGTVLMNSLFCRPGYYLIEESSPTSAGNNQWFISNLLPEVAREAKAAGTSVYEVMNEWVAEVPAEEFVPVFLPFLMASNVHPNAKGSFVGMSMNHTRKHLARSVYEGIAFSHRHHLEKLLATRENRPECIRLAGGAAHSAVWTRMFADIMGIPVETVDVNETGALGSAIAAAAAVGAYASLEEAAKNMCPIGERVCPDMRMHKVYSEKYALYQKTIQCLDGLWADMQKLIEKGCG
ncbi:MAG: carbohydrate kinase [Clostridiales bacterium]|nr:carbohydrate kinase [Clostridiales bacterium]OPZ70238.1 MAG: L-xylulose/3-keto-L-gulonate kinase [Firmicutes bacterium ADurb.Bin467]